MKNEKFCFSKGTGLIALVGILLVGVVFFAQIVNQQTSTSTKAAGSCFYSYSGTRYEIPDGGCLKDTIPGWNTSLKCTSGRVGPKTTDCAPAAAAGTCWYGGVEATVDSDFCVLVGTPATKNGYKCRTSGTPAALVAGRNSAVKDTTGTCAAPVGAPSCWYGNADVSANADTGSTTSTGCISTAPGYRCRLTSAGALVAGKNSAVKDTVKCPVAAAAGTCWYGGNDVSADANLTTGCLASTPGYKCRVASGALVAGRNSAVKDSTTCPVAAAAGVCLYANQDLSVTGTYGMDGGFCVTKYNAAIDSNQKIGYKCRTSGTPAALVAGRNSAVKDSTGACRKQCSDTNCGTVAYGTCGTNHQVCKCSDPASYTEVAGLVYNAATCP